MSTGTKLTLIIGGVLLSAVLVIGIWGFTYASGLQKTGVRQEQQLSTEYENNQNYLSTFISTFHETIGIANLKTDRMNEILTNAVSGRYGEDGFSADGAFFSAVSEAYPDLGALDIFDDIVTQVQAGREGFRGRQSKLLDELRVYDTWRLEGLLQPTFVRMLGFPSENLNARVGGEIVASGPAALEQFRNLVLTGSTVEAFETGRMEPLEVPRN